MKELSIEEKAKAYDEALKVLHKYDGAHIMFTQDLKEEMFPELKESEDEKTKRLLHTIANKMSQYLRDIFSEEEFQCFDAWSNAWLEKQVSQDDAEDVDILHRFSFYSYKDEPNVLYLSGLYVNEEYRNKGIGTKILEVADEVAKSLDCHAIRLKTKKDSDAERLYRTHGYNSLATEDKDEIWLEKQGEQKSYASETVNEKGDFDSDFTRMMEKEQKPWSEEDKEKLNRIYSILRQAADTHAFSTSCRLIGDKECVELQDFLKSLRPQNRWKPSDEQMGAFKMVFDWYNKNFPKFKALDSLYNDLNKLKEIKL